MAKKQKRFRNALGQFAKQPTVAKKTKARVHPKKTTRAASKKTKAKKKTRTDWHQMFTSIYPKNYSKESKIGTASTKARIGYYMKIRKIYNQIHGGFYAMSDDFESITRSLIEYYRCDHSSYNFVVSDDPAQIFWKFSIKYKSTVKSMSISNVFRSATYNIGDLSWISDFEDYVFHKTSPFHPGMPNEGTPSKLDGDKCRIYWICIETWAVSINKFKERTGEIGKRQSNYIRYY